MSDTVIYSARAIVTMNPSRPLATHVAVRDGRIVAVGSREELSALRDARLDERFADNVLLPGFVEGHAHVLEGKVWSMTYVGFGDRRAPDGRLVAGLASIEAVVERLKAASDAITDPDAPLMAWGFDPIYFKSRRMNRHDLDRVSTTRPVMVLHASLHISNVNSLLLERAGFDRGTNISGVLKLEDGTPSGELQGIAARLRAFRVVGMQGLTGTIGREEVTRYGQSALIQGITTIADLHNDLPDDVVDLYRELAAGDELPIRLVPALASVSHAPKDGVEKIRRLRTFNSDRLHFGLVKLVVDGSIQGFTARLSWPGYWNGAANGLWYIAPEQLGDIVSTYHEAGIQLHIHTNGDEATGLAIEALEAALTAHPRPDHRHTLQHCQLASQAQFRRMKALGLCVNLFSNHIFHWGDAHYEQTVGPERACRMNATGTAERLGMPYAIHSDAPVTPLGPLFTAWCAVNRKTSSGRLLGAEERISVSRALAAVTLGAAYTLKLDHLVGSIEAGKFADFAVLEKNPLEVAPERLKDIAVWGVVTGGRVVEAPR
ncbi:MAG: amidohydrolase [Hyphomicrobiales bacterium]